MEHALDVIKVINLGSLVNALVNKKIQIVNNLYMINAKDVQMDFILIKIGIVLLYHLCVDNMIKTLGYVQVAIMVISYQIINKDNA